MRGFDANGEQDFKCRIRAHFGQLDKPNIIENGFAKAVRNSFRWTIWPRADPLAFIENGKPLLKLTELFDIERILLFLLTS